jgi:hypothetical protein
MAGTGKPGRPSLGDRTKHTLKLPAYLTPLVKAHCQQTGTSLNDLAVEALIEKLGLPKHVQGELPLSDAA